MIKHYLLILLSLTLVSTNVQARSSVRISIGIPAPVVFREPCTARYFPSCEPPTPVYYVPPPPVIYQPTFVPSPSYSEPYSGTSPNYAQTVILKVQLNLQRAGLYTGHCDGLLGPATRQAIFRFQALNRLPQTGQIDTQVSFLLNR